MSASYRVEWRWLPMGPLLGYFSGLVTVAALGLLSPPLLLVTIPCGLVVGGPIGAGVGLFAGLPLVFLVGPHLSRRSAGMITWLGPFPYAAATVLGGVTSARTARIDIPRAVAS